MIDRIIEWSLRNRFLVLCTTLLLVGLGARDLAHAPIDAIPDLSENQVIVFADWPGRSPREVEDQVTFPLTSNLQGLAGVKTVRASSMFGFTFATVIFEDSVDRAAARLGVIERLNQITEQLPSGVSARLGPDASGLGWVYQYYLSVDPKRAPAGGYDLAQLRSIQDWFIRYQLNSVPGVAEVGGIGGFVQQYQIEASPHKMRARQVTLSDLLHAVQQSNLNVGGKVIEESGMEFVVRGVGLIRSTADLEQIAIKESGGAPVYLRDVATVQVGGEFRRGALDLDGHEVVGGIVVMRNGANARDVIARVKERVAQISSGLPPGISIQPFYDRSLLIERSIATLKRTLLEEIVLVALAHVVFLWHFRSILIVTIPLPASILISFILMRCFGITSNIMSLSGIAIAIGVLVDAGIVMTENVIRQCERAEEEKRRRSASDIPVRLTPVETLQATRRAARQVGRPIFFAMVIILLAFIPVFGLLAEEGKLFHPLAFAKTFAMAGATLLAVTLVPVLCSVWVRGPYQREEDNVVMKRLLRLYLPALRWALAHRNAIVGSASALLLGAALLAFGLPRAGSETVHRIAGPALGRLADGLGSEFMPALNEGSLLFMPTLLPSTSLTEVKRVMAWQDAALKQVPEVKSAAGKLGRADTATDPAPVEMIETTIELYPESQWRKGLTRESLIAELNSRLSQVPGCVPGFLQPIEGRLLMLSTGIRAQVGIKLFGDDLASLEKKAVEAERILKGIPGASGVTTSRTQGKPYVEIEVDRNAIARYGLRAQDVLEVVETGLGGRNVTTAVSGRKRIPVQVRLERAQRDDITRLADIAIPTGAGTFIPLSQVAQIKRTLGPSEISSENGRLKATVQANVIGCDLGTFVKEARRRIASELALEPGMTLEWSGQYENQLRAQERLRIIVPVVLAIIFILLYMLFRSATEAAHILLAVPFALTGGFLLQRILGYPFSVAVWVGYIALFGIAIQTAVVMVVYLNEAWDRIQKTRGTDAALSITDLHEAVAQGAILRLRPKVMTAVTTLASLLPITWSTSTGSEVMRSLAVPVLGGILSSFLHILILTPVLFSWLKEREIRRANAAA